MSETQNSGCLGALLRLFGGTPPVVRKTNRPFVLEDEQGDPLFDSEQSVWTDFPYRVRDDFLSPAELSFHYVLTTALAESAVVCPKVRLSDLFFVSAGRKNYVAQNRIAQKHVDFLICAPRTMKPLFAVELDDASHARSDRQDRDEFVNQVFDMAGLPLLRIPTRRGYTIEALRTQMEPFLNSAVPTTVEKPKPVASGTPLLCPKCGVRMVVRTSTRGANSGRQFFGCPNYPRCRETVPIANEGIS